MSLRATTGLRPWHTVRSLWRRDELARATLVLFAVVVVVYLLPFPEDFKSWLTDVPLPLLFSSLAVLAILSGISRLDEIVERRFWKDLAAAVGFWMLDAGARGLSGPIPGVGTEILRDLLVCAYYLLLILAIESRPHRVSSGPLAGLSRALSWPGAMAFVVGLLLYFVWIPASHSPPAYASGLPSLYLFVCLDLYLVINLAYLAWTTSSSRWARIYASLAGALGLSLCSDLAELRLNLGGVPWPVELDFLWVLPLVALALSARRRNLLPDLARSAKPNRRDTLSGPSGRTLVTALAFPTIHFTLYALGFLDPSSRAMREQLVLGWLPLLGAIAFFQSRLLDRRTRSLLAERAQFKHSLESNEKDLRLMVERVHAQDLVQESELKFARAFRASPDVMVVSSMEEGRLIDVNSAFEQATGFTREEVIGRTSQELNLWARPAEREKMLEVLMDRRWVHNQPAVFRVKSGQPGLGLLSAEIITLGTSEVTLSVFHDLTFQTGLPGGPSADPPDSVLGLLDHGSDALIVIDSEQRIGYWNRGAERLLGWQARETLGTLASDTWLTPERARDQTIHRVLREQGRWSGRVEMRTRDAGALSLETWWIQAPGAKGESIWVLAFT